MTTDEIRNKVREITHTTTNNYSDASLIRDLNSEIIAMHTQLSTDRGPLEFDDPNNTGYSIEDITITGGTDTYDIQTDEHSDVIYAVHKVVFNERDIPRLMFTEGTQDQILNATGTAVTPNGYFDLGKAIKFAQIPADSGTATIYYTRAHHTSVVGDTTEVVGLPTPYHQALAYRVGYNYALDKNLSNLDRILQRLTMEEERLALWEEARRVDEGTVITVETTQGI